MTDRTYGLVIVGRGYAAVANAVTRYHTGSLPPQTVLVGVDDPWSTYVDHPMGQYPSLLAIPGFDVDLHPSSSTRYHSSALFAQATRDQRDRLIEAGIIEELLGEVDETPELEGDLWKLRIREGAARREIFTRQVDFCTGPGSARSFDPDGRKFGPWGQRVVVTAEMRRELRAPRTDRNFYRTAHEFMEASKAEGDLLVVGEGPLAANVVEHALNPRTGARSVTWVGGSKELSTAFPESERYDDLIANAEHLRSRASTLSARERAHCLLPADPRLTILTGLVTRLDRGTAWVTGPNPGIHPWRIDSSGCRARDSFHVVTADHLVISAGSIDGTDEVGSIANLVWEKKLEPIINEEMFTGISVSGPADSRLRVLGAAARNGYLIEDLAARGQHDEAEGAFRFWHDSLCAQARMRRGSMHTARYAMGITVGAAAIARANRYYRDTDEDRCAQTALLPEPMAASRRSRTAPYTEDELSDSEGDLSSGFRELPKSENRDGTTRS